jgi:tetratricopeptide (TPR) repeat protein
LRSQAELNPDIMNILQRLILPFYRTAAQKQLLYGSRKKAVAMFERILRWSDTAENRFNLALARMNLREYETAIELLKPIHSQLPDQIFAGITYGQCLLLARRFEDAGAVYDKLLEANPQNNLLKMLSGLSRDPVGRDKFSASLDMQLQAALLEAENRNSEALELLQKAAGLTPEDAALFNNTGALKLKLKYPLKEVMADFHKAMHLSPDNDRYKRNYRKVWQKSQK